MSNHSFNWSAKDKDRFFAALARRGRYNTPAIAKDLPSKTEAEIVAYIHLLETARNELSKVLPLHISSYPTAREVPDTVIQWEEREVEEKRKRETRGLKKMGLQKGLLYMKGRSRGTEFHSQTHRCKEKTIAHSSTSSSKKHSVFNTSKALDLAKIAYTQKPTAIARPTLHAIQNALLDWLIPTVRDIGFAALERRNMSKRTSKSQQTISVFDDSVEAALLLQSSRNASTCRTRQEEYELLDRVRHLYSSRQAKEGRGIPDDKEDSVETVPQGLLRGKKRRRDDDEQSTNDEPSLIERGTVSTVSDPDNLPRRNIKRLRTSSENGNKNRNRELEIQVETTVDHEISTITEEEEDDLSDWERELHEEAHLEFYEREKDRRYLKRALPQDVVSLLEKETGKIGTARTRFRMTKPDPFEIDDGSRCCVRGCSFRASQIQDDDETSDSDWWSVLHIKRNKWGMPVAQRQDTDSGSKKSLKVDDLLDDWSSDSSTSESSGYSSSDIESEFTSWTPTGCLSSNSSSPPESVSYEGYLSPLDSDSADGKEETDQSDGWVDDSENEDWSDRDIENEVGFGQASFWKPELVSGDEASSDGGRDEWNYGDDLLGSEVDEV